ncbi:MAG: flotillin family protein [Lachnospiraceae bacterium]|nr:flotillin family protein [Lachnospiraceae bacterium]MBR4993395.1 flotillin family protein [Lachnospiraceae bacterium]MBR5943578.1 flotillin family protein [Lachnospiraceae bacterium]
MELIIIAVVAAIILCGIIASGYVKAPPDKAFIISGLKKNPKILIGRAGVKLPFLERKDTLVLKQISIDIKTNGYVPTLDFIGVDIDAVAKVRVKTDPDGIKVAMKNFLNMDEPTIIRALTDSLQGNMREIIGTVKLKELNTDRKKFGDEVQEKAQKDMNALGIEIISCNIQKIEDEKGLIIALGQDNMSQIQKDASIAKAQADKDVAIAEAEAKRLANEAQVAAETEIAAKQNELRIKQAELKRESDTRQAEADAAYEIQQQEQRKTIEITTANANIARQEREIELRKKDVEVTEQTLEAEIKKKAEAEKFARQQRAEADLFERQRKAEAEKFEREKEAEAKKIQAEADLFSKEKEAEGIRMVGEAEAKAIEAKGIAEAEAMEKKAEAMKKYGQAAMIEMIVKALPDMAGAIAKPLENIDKVTIIDGGNGDTGVNSMGSYVPGVLAKTMETVKEVTGLDIVDIMKANTYEAKVTRNVNVTGLEDAPKGKAKEAVKAAVVKDAVTPEE